MNLSVVATLILFASSALAEESEIPAAQEVDNSQEEEIVVTGFRNSYKLTGKQLAEALSVFNKKREGLAPEARLLFQVKSLKQYDISSLTLSLRSGDKIIPLYLDNNSRFVLPHLEGRNWELVSNGKAGGLSVSPLIISPGTQDSDRLLGDLRLQCEVSWALVKPETSIFARTLFSSAGGCQGNKFAYYVSTNRTISSAEVMSGDIRRLIHLWGGNRYQAPVGDKVLPNSARVRITFK